MKGPAPQLTVVAVAALATVRLAEPPLDAKLESPAKLAATALGYVPALMPDKLILLRVATPLPSVVALPALLPFNVKLIILPLMVELSEVLLSVAESVVVPP
jgi:hypothetical protein